MTTSDEDEINIVNLDFLKAWNKGDAKAAASFFTEDGVRIGAMGDIGCGREEIAKALDNLIHKSMTGAKAKTANESVRMLTTEFAIW